VQGIIAHCSFRDKIEKWTGGAQLCFVLSTCLAPPDSDALTFQQHYDLKRGPVRVARFVFTQYSKTWENIPNHSNMSKWPWNIPNDSSIFQITIKDTSIFQSRTLQNLPKFGFLVWKQTIWQPWDQWYRSL
jgi:hypothetical protein